MLSKTERQILMMYINVSAVPSDGPRHDIKETLEIIKNFYDNNKAFIYFDEKLRFTTPDKSNDVLYIADMIIDEDIEQCRILINRGDHNLTDPVFLNHKDKKTRSINRKKDEVVGCSAHIIIDLKKPVPGMGYKMLFERVPTVSRTKVIDMLSRFLEIYSVNQNLNFNRKNKKETRNLGYRIKLNSSFATSKQLKKDLKSGTISSVDLIETEVKDGGLDKDPIIKKTTKKLTLKVDSKKITDPVSWLNGIKSMASNKGYDQICVHIRNLEGPQSSKDARFATDLQDASEVLYSKIELIDGFNKELAQCIETIDLDIIAKMDNILINQVYWK